MRAMSFVAMIVSLALVGGSMYLFFTGHFAALTAVGISGVALYLFAFALMVMLRFSKPDGANNAVGGGSSYSPANY